MFEGVPFPVICLVVFLHQGIRGEDVKTVTGYLGESVDLRADADPSWNLHEISWSIYENDTSIAISQSNEKNVDRFYLFTGRLELNTTSGDLTINNLSFIDALKYTVELIGQETSQRRTRYFQLSVQVRLFKPRIRLRHSILDSGYCVISLGCVSMNDKVSLFWKPKSGFNEPFWSGQQGQAGESVLWTAFTPNRVVTFTCIAVNGSQRELREKNVTCQEPEPQGNNTQPGPTELISERSRIGIFVLIVIFVLILLIGFIVALVIHKLKGGGNQPDTQRINSTSDKETPAQENVQLDASASLTKTNSL